MKFKGSIFWFNGKKETKEFPLVVRMEGHHLDHRYMIEEEQTEDRSVKIATIIAVILREGIFEFHPKFFKKGVTFFAGTDGRSCLVRVDKVISY